MIVLAIQNNREVGIKKVNRHERNVKAFLTVRDKLNKPETRAAFRLCWKKPYRFYGEHTMEEAIKILMMESGNGAMH